MNYLKLINKFYVDLTDEEIKIQRILFLILSIISFILYCYLRYSKPISQVNDIIMCFMMILYIISSGSFIFSLISKKLNNITPIFYYIPTKYIELDNFGNQLRTDIFHKHNVNINGMAGFFFFFVFGLITTGLTIINHFRIFMMFLIVSIPLVILFIRVFILKENIYPIVFDYDDMNGIILFFEYAFLSAIAGYLTFIFLNSNFISFIISILIILLICYTDKFLVFVPKSLLTIKSVKVIIVILIILRLLLHILFKI